MVFEATPTASSAKERRVKTFMFVGSITAEEGGFYRREVGVRPQEFTDACPNGRTGNRDLFTVFPWLKTRSRLSLTVGACRFRQALQLN